MAAHRLAVTADLADKGHDRTAPAPGCVVVCVVTLQSLPVSGRYPQCHSGTREKQ